MTKQKSPGMEFQGQVKRILDGLQPTCSFWRLPTDLRLARRGKGLMLAHGDPMPADFIGWGPSGKAILIECKDVDQHRLKLGGSPGLSPFQMQAAKLAHQTGSVRYLAVWKRGEAFVIFDPGSVEARSVAWVIFLHSPLALLEEKLRAAILYG